MNKKTLKVVLFGFLCATTMNKADANVRETASSYAQKAWDGTKGAAGKAGKGLRRAGSWMSDKWHNFRHKDSSDTAK